MQKFESIVLTKMLLCNRLFVFCFFWLHLRIYFFVDTECKSILDCGSRFIFMQVIKNLHSVVCNYSLYWLVKYSIMNTICFCFIVICLAAYASKFYELSNVVNDFYLLGTQLLSLTTQLWINYYYWK